VTGYASSQSLRSRTRVSSGPQPANTSRTAKYPCAFRP